MRWGIKITTSARDVQPFLGSERSRRNLMCSEVGAIMSDDQYPRAIKIYIAAPSANRAEAARAAQAFTAAGFKVVSRWTSEHKVGLKFEDPASFAALQQEAIDDIRDIVLADVFVILNLQMSEGKATELGIAYMLGKPVILVGKRRINVFYFLPYVTEVETVDEAIKWLEAEQ
jgi:nucleoside 2-deoxyribosyltransferase